MDHAQSKFRRLFVVAIGLTCTAALAIGATIWWLRGDKIADAYLDSSNLAIVLAGQIENSAEWGAALMGTRASLKP
jgi:hypothetical protein